MLLPGKSLFKLKHYLDLKDNLFLKCIREVVAFVAPESSVQNWGFWKMNNLRVYIFSYPGQSHFPVRILIA